VRVESSDSHFELDDLPVAPAQPEPPPSGSMCARILSEDPIHFEPLEPTILDVDAMELALRDGAPVFPSTLDSVVHVVTRPQVFGLAGNSPHVYALQSKRGGLTDSGANICMTNDPSLLIDIRECSPFHILQAMEDGAPSASNVCDRMGMLALPKEDGSAYYQPTFVNTHAAGTFISPQAIVDGSRDKFTTWKMTGNTRGKNGSIQFFDTSGDLAISLTLIQENGLCFCPTDVFLLCQGADLPTSLPTTVTAAARPVTRAQQ